MADASRRQEEKSAMVLSSILGVAAILGSVFFLPKFYCENPSATCPSSATSFDVAWTRGVAATQLHTFTGAGSFSVEAKDVLVGGVRVNVGNCADSASGGPSLQSAADIVFTVTSTQDGFPRTDSKHFTCLTATGASVDIPFPAHPDVATATGPNETVARANVLSSPSVKASSATYTITVVVSRTQTTPVLPAQLAATLSLDLQAQAMAWSPTLAPHQAEVQK